MFGILLLDRASRYKVIRLEFEWVLRNIAGWSSSMVNWSVTVGAIVNALERNISAFVRIYEFSHLSGGNEPSTLDDDQLGGVGWQNEPLKSLQILAPTRTPSARLARTIKMREFSQNRFNSPQTTSRVRLPIVHPPFRYSGLSSSR